MLTQFTVKAGESAEHSISAPSSKPFSFQVPNLWVSFARYFEPYVNGGHFLGRDTESPTIKVELANAIARAKALLLDESISLEPSHEAKELTKEAVKAFFRTAVSLVHDYDPGDESVVLALEDPSDVSASLHHDLERLLNSTVDPVEDMDELGPNEASAGMRYPLAGKNKCLGFVQVPDSNLVLIAISQDKNPAKDEKLRKEFGHFLQALNRAQDGSDYEFELVSVPTKEQYLMVRMLNHTCEWSAPEQSMLSSPTRCVEVALASALNKVGRFKAFEPDSIGMLTYGSALWELPDRATPLAGFTGPVVIEAEGHTVEQYRRNTKHVNPEDPNLKIPLADGRIVWLDKWKPCEGHCQPYLAQIRAMCLSGGPASSFSERRGEPLFSWDDENKQVHIEDRQLRPKKPTP